MNEQCERLRLERAEVHFTVIDGGVGEAAPIPLVGPWCRGRVHHREVRVEGAADDADVAGGHAATVEAAEADARVLEA